MHRPKLDRPTAEQILTTREMAAVDKAAVDAGLSVATLMEAAGRAVADAVPGKQPVHVLCGPGNNGGDGYVAARLLREAGHSVRIFAAQPPKSGSAAAHHAKACGTVEPLEAFQPLPGTTVIDAIYGAGLARPIEGAEREAIRRLNASDAFTLSVDVPSGLDGDTGQASETVVEANATVTFFRRKPGHLLWPGRALCGDVIVADIGLTEAHLVGVGHGRLFHNNPGLWYASMPAPTIDSHKYQRGHAIVISGGEFRTGAARLTGAAALNAGSGAVTILGDAAALRIHAAHVSAIMLHELTEADDIAQSIARLRPSAAVIGPAAGTTDVTFARFMALLSQCVPTVADADALTASVGKLDELATRKPEATLVLTPHAGEFERLFGDIAPVDAVPSKVERARAAAKAAHAVIVFKGIDTVIAAPDGRAAINDNGGSELATAGSGDVLAGIIAAHLAQGMPVFEAAAAGVFLHAAWGSRFGAGLTADRLVQIVRPLSALDEMRAI